MGGEPIDVVTLVPYRPNGDRQRWCWDQVRPKLEALGYPVVTGEPLGDDWSRGQACNAAAKNAGAWDVAIITDCDTVPEELSIRRALMWLELSGGAVRPHMQRTMLNQKGTIVYCQRGPDHLERAHLERQHAGGGVLVITREAFDRLGGYDETLIGWGYEDTEFNLRLLREGLWERIPGRAWHLFHTREHNAPRPESRQRYRELMREYRRDVERWAFDKGLAQPQKVL